MICCICNINLSKRLDSHVRNEHKLNPSVYYYKYILKLEQPPTCANPECMNIPDFRYICEGYKKFCSISCVARHNRTKNWQDSNYRSRMLQVLKDNVIQQSNDEDYKQMQSLAQIARWQDPIYRLNQSEKKKQQWREDSTYRSKMEMHLKQNIKDLWNDPEFKAKKAKEASQRLLDKWKDPKYRAERTEQSKQKMKEWWEDPTKRSKLGHYLGKHQSPKISEPVLYRSIMELDYLKSLDSDDNILSYQVEPFKIDYQFEGRTRGYYPDVLICCKDGTKQLVEVKPRYFLDSPINISKFDAAANYCNVNNISFIIKTEFDVYKDGKFKMSVNQTLP